MIKNNKKTTASREQQVLQDVLASMPVAVAWANPRTNRIEFINSKFTSMFGYVLDDLSTLQNWLARCYLDPEQARLISEFWQQNLEGGDRAIRALEDVELDIICKDGSIKTVLSGKIMLPQNSGALATFLDITPRKLQESLIRQQAVEDPLTGLFNRRGFSQDIASGLQQCSARDTGMALLLVDLDGFKAINDSLGHDHGDQILIDVAGCMRQAVREQDVLCRVGGDEFGVILHNLNSQETARVIAGRILNGLSQLGKESGTGLSASIGIAYCPQDGRSEETLFKCADQALYRAKDAGKDCWKQ